MKKAKEYQALMMYLVTDKEVDIFYCPMPGRSKADMWFTIPGQSKRRNIDMNEIVGWIQERYEVPLEEPLLQQFIAFAKAELKRQVEQDRAYRKEQRAQAEDYARTYGPFHDYTREQLIDEIHLLRATVEKLKNLFNLDQDDAKLIEDFANDMVTHGRVALKEIGSNSGFPLDIHHG